MASVTARTELVLRGSALDDAPRWQPGDRLEHIFEESCDRDPAAIAVDGPRARLTYAQLDASANRLARFLAENDLVRPGDRVGLLFDCPSDAYAALLAVLKLHATYVPLDPGFPGERMAYIAADADLRVVLTSSSLRSSLALVEAHAAVVSVDEHEPAIAAQPGTRPTVTGSSSDNELCYVIYTSGTTGRPKGVAVSHASICNFVRVAAEVYGVRVEDRVYQGLTIAFDFAVEEIWVAWAVGATLVPKPTSASLLGDELHRFLTQQRVTAVCCVPTLLETIDEDLPEVRFLLVSGESCPADLVKRWARRRRRFLNVYGPTEATVTATWTVLDPDRPVTIGVPLPTYSVVILDPDEDRALAQGEEGEIGLAGIGLAEGYLNDHERTERAFIRDFLGIEGNPSGRIYRTGDLGRINEDGEIEHLGRIDTQVQIRGYRVELGEVEAVLRELPDVAQAVVSTWRSGAGGEELVAYCTRRNGGVNRERAYELLRDRLPSYMVPAYLEELDELPLLPSGKVDRPKLPDPTVSRAHASAATAHVEPETAAEHVLAETLSRVLAVDRVSVDDHFFDQLGANSLLMARFAADLRRHTDLPPVSMREVYLNPTVRLLAAAITGDQREEDAAPVVELDLPPVSGTPRFVLCGILQALALLVGACIAGAAFFMLSMWVAGAHGVLAIYAGAVAFGGVTLGAAFVLPIAAKWLLVGRWKPQRVRVWSLAYFRFWVVKTLVSGNPATRLLVGTPLYNLYLRALGADVAADAVILTTHMPVATDLLQIGAGAVVRKDAYLNGYRIVRNAVEVGSVSIGNRAVVGERAVLDIQTRIGDAGQLGHASALLAGQAVPSGECWHGSPGRPAAPGYDYDAVPARPCGRRRRIFYSLARLATILAVVGPLEAIVATMLFTHPPFMRHMSLAWAPLIALAIEMGLLSIGLVVAKVVPGLLSRLLVPGVVYPLYGVRYGAARLASRFSNMPALAQLFGDSSAVVWYLRWIGYRLGVVEQTGSNFGVEVTHEIPTLCEVGTGTMVSDGLSFMNADYSSSSFRVVPVAIPERSYLGNDLVFPAGARVGADCLYGTKTMIPLAGPVREGVGLLGSPPFEIPRTVERDEEHRRLSAPGERERRLTGKNRHNMVTAALYLAVLWIVIAVEVLFAVLPIEDAFGIGGVLGTAVTTLLDVLVIPLALFVPVERLVIALHPLRPKTCSIYREDFWRHERFWKLSTPVRFRSLEGTPFKGAVWRLHGVRVGRRLLDDGCKLIERSVVSLGDDVVLNEGAVIQAHSLEDGVFKLDHIEIGDRCTVGTAGFVHYGTVMEEGALLDADAFLMKGSRVPSGAHWRGNPAADV